MLRSVAAVLAVLAAVDSLMFGGARTHLVKQVAPSGDVARASREDRNNSSPAIDPKSLDHDGVLAMLDEALAVERSR